MNKDRWFELVMEGGSERLPYSWPERTRQMWQAQIKPRVGRGIRKSIKALDKGLVLRYPLPALVVVFPRELPVTGHLLSIRKVPDNLQPIQFEGWRTEGALADPKQYVGTDAVLIWTKHVLRKLAELSPLFGPVWEELKGLPAGKCGIHLAGEPDAAWLESIRPNEERLYERFRGTQNLDKIGLDPSPPREEVDRRHEYAVNLMMEGQYQEGEAVLEDLLARCPGVWRGYCDLARSALSQGEPKRAYHVVRRAQARYPDALHFDRLAADCAMDLKDWPRAEWHLKRLWGLNPWDPNLLSRYARVAFQMGDHALAGKLYEDCSEGMPLDFASQIDYGNSLHKTGRGREALAVFRDLEKCNPGSATLLNNIGFVLAGLGRPLEALDCCRRALELEPGREAFWDSLGFVQLKMQNYREAARAFLKAVELNPSFPDAWRHLLHAYDRSGQAEKLAGARKWVGGILPGEVERFEKERGTDIPD